MTSREPLIREFEMATGGLILEIDRIAMCCELFEEMDEGERDRVMAYLNHKFRGVS